MSIQLYHNY